MAMSSYRRALQCAPEDASIHRNLDNVLLRLGRMKDALAEYRKALELAPDDPDVHTSLAVWYCLAGNFRKAVEHRNAVLRAGRDVPRPVARIIEQHLEAGCGASQKPRRW